MSLLIPSHSIKQSAIYPWLWLLGTPLTFALLATGLVGSERLRRASTPVTHDALVETLSRLQTTLGVGKQVALAACDRITQPILLGIFRPLILLPTAALSGWSPAEIEMVLLHELAHVRRYDNLVNLLQRLVESLLFFHPAIWLVSRQVRRDREQCCDALVVAHTAQPQAYAELLVSIASKTPSLATASALANHSLTGRIRRILHLEDEPMLVSRNTLGTIALTVALLVALAFWQPGTTTVAEEQVVEVVETKVDAESSEANEQETSTTPAVESAIPVFLPLEQQKIIDLAYKMLGVELGLPGVEDLARAKANKFEGGLLVTESIGGGFDHSHFQKGDILVGLHVWPIKSLEDLAAVLERDDIAEISPLKFYVIRTPKDNGGGGVRATEQGLITGRVPVNLDAVRITSAIPTPKKQLSNIESSLRIYDTTI